MHFFKRWKKKEEPRTFTFAREDLLELARLKDQSDTQKVHVTHMLLWNFIASRFPEVEQGAWELVMASAFNCFVREKI